MSGTTHSGSPATPPGVAAATRPAVPTGPAPGTGGAPTGQDPWPDARALDARIHALTRFREVVEPYLPPERLQPARVVAERARQRLGYSADLTVVALAGPTGSGKSSLFNALAGEDLSPVGVRRPTTGATHACVWGPPVEATPLLDWLQIPAGHRSAHQLAPDQAALSGMVLLDLPDFDSMEQAHASEVERMLNLVDAVVWVVDPQKYADQVIHERYLRPFQRYRDVTMVALNQADLLTADDCVQVLDDLHRLLGAEGLGGVATMATSAVDLPAGTAQLRAQLSQLVSSRRAAWQRLAADVDGVVEDLADLVGPPVAADAADRAAFGELADGLADAAGVPAMAEAAEAAYRQRAGAQLGWLAWWRAPHAWAAPADGLPAPGIETTTGRVTARLAARTVAVRAADGLPPPWPDAVLQASRSRLPALPGAVAAAVAADTGRRADRGRWWRLVGAGMWVFAAAMVVGFGWLLVGWLISAVALPLAHPRVGPVPVPVLLLVGGGAAGGLAAALVQPVLGWAARRARIRARREMRAAVAQVGREHVVAPVREVLHAYGQARAALYTAAGLG